MYVLHPLVHHELLGNIPQPTRARPPVGQLDGVLQGTDGEAIRCNGSDNWPVALTSSFGARCTITIGTPGTSACTAARARSASRMLADFRVITSRSARLAAERCSRQGPAG